MLVETFKIASRVVAENLHNATSMWKHWVARACTPFQPFLEFENACWFWKKFENGFPERVMAILMPNHLHLILPEKVKDPSRRIYGLLGAMSSRLNTRTLWQPVPEPQLIPDRSHLRRQVRYVALNPCRKKLCRDPLEWYWSAYRDVVGAIAESSLNSLAKTLGDKEKDFKVRFHSYVSGDPSVSVIGTSFPQKAESSPDLAQYAIGEILAASAAALRVGTSEIQQRHGLRKLFIHLADQQGWCHTADLAKVCKITQQAVRRILKQSCPPGIAAAELCLGDRRLRRFADAKLDRGVWDTLGLK